MVCIHAAGTITAPHAALFFIIAVFADKSKGIYRFARFLLFFRKLGQTAINSGQLIVLSVYLVIGFKII